MKKVVSIVLVLVLCLGCCFALSACNDESKFNSASSKSELFDLQTQKRIAELSLKSVVSSYNSCISEDRGLDITKKTTIKDIVDFIVSKDCEVKYTYLDENTIFLDVCELSKQDNYYYVVKDGIAPYKYYHSSNRDVDLSKRLIAEDTFRGILKLVDILELWSQIDDETTIQQVVDMIEAKGETISTKHLNLSCIFRSAAKPNSFHGMSSTVLKDVEWLDFFVE